MLAKLLKRLFNALKYLFTGKLATDGGSPQEIAPPDAKPPPSPANEASYLIMKDSHESADGTRTAIEVRSDGIHVADASGTQQVVPLTASGFSLAQIDEDIRYQIARKISLLVPELGDYKQKQLLKHVFRVLFLMAEDQLPRVRRMIAEELRDSYDAPPELIRKLAWDEELEVAAPILEFSPLLGDGDLLEIIANSNIPGVVEAISRRKEMGADVTDAIVRNVTRSPVTEDDARIINNLLENKRARFREDTLEIIVEEAPGYEIWHRNLIDRPELTTRTINKIARFVSEALIMEMEDRGMITKELGQNLTQAIASRLHNPHIDREKEADRMAIDLFTQGNLDAQYVMAALDGGEREFVIASLSLLSDVPKSAIKRIIESDDPKAVSALAWKAGIPMREAIQLQLKLAKIHYSRLLYAREGTDYPLSEDEMRSILTKYMTKAA